MAFTNSNSGSSGTGSITSAEITEIKKNYKEKSKPYSAVDEEEIKCDKITCRFNIEEGKCSLQFCFYDDTEWKPQKETFKFKCQICNTEVTGDTKNADMRICDHCLTRMKEMGTLKTCKVCGRPMVVKNIALWETGICDVCLGHLSSVLTKDPRPCPFCGTSHTSMPVPLTNICPACVPKIIKAMDLAHEH